MLRTFTIAALVILNLSVWLGPAERFTNMTVQALNPAPRMERAEQYVLEENLEAAYLEYKALAELHPNNLDCRYEFGLFCYINANELNKRYGYSRVEISQIAQEELYAARQLNNEDYRLAYEYAFILMDHEMMRWGVSREDALEAWEHVLQLVEARHDVNENWYEYSIKAAQSYTQMARVESRFGELDLAGDYIDRALEIDPDFRISSTLIADNARLFGP